MYSYFLSVLHVTNFMSYSEIPYIILTSITVRSQST